ncbi:MAG: hypothetical protein FJ100_14405 [Deltaproteobacteria bacterium]|nr:hypothetical protein [Deltaproteobacteria bacterium]
MRTCSYRNLRTLFVAAGSLCAVLASACGDPAPPAGGGTTTATDASTADAPADGSGRTGGGADSATGTADTILAGGPVETDELKVAITVLGDQALLKGVVIKPAACSETSKCPFIVVVGDYDHSAFPDYVPGAKQLAGALKVGLAVFNLPGLGAGSGKSEGEDDVGGKYHQAAVKDVMHLKAAAKWVDGNRIGYLTIGTGLISVTKALKTFGTTSTLKNVKFLIDVEGPVDRCSISQAPMDEAANIGPADGPGATDSSCHFSSSGGGTHANMYPPKTGNKPASIVCAPGAWPITKTGAGCNDNSWWSERDPYTALKSANYRYQRIQFKHDHRLPSYWASRLAIQALASSPSKYFQLNNMEPCGAAWSDAECEGQPCWLEGPYGNGMVPAPYSDGGLVKVTFDALFTQVLPGYVKRMLDTEANKDCR